MAAHAKSNHETSSLRPRARSFEQKTNATAADKAVRIGMSAALVLPAALFGVEGAYATEQEPADAIVSEGSPAAPTTAEEASDQLAAAEEHAAACEDRYNEAAAEAVAAEDAAAEAREQLDEAEALESKVEAASEQAEVESASPAEEDLGLCQPAEEPESAGMQMQMALGRQEAEGAEIAGEDAAGAGQQPEESVSGPQLAAATTEAQFSADVYGFLQYIGCTDGLSAIDESTYARFTKAGAADDATGFKSLSTSASYIRECNTLRAKHGLAPLKVSPLLLAMAAADANYSDTTVGHAMQFAVGENLAYNYGSDPFKQWYDDEKKAYEATGDKSAAGHYFNVINPDYTVTGFATCYRGTMHNWRTYAQTFAMGAGYEQGVMTVDEFESAVNAFLAKYKKDSSASSGSIAPGKSEGTAQRANQARQTYKAAEERRVAARANAEAAWDDLSSARADVILAQLDVERFAGQDADAPYQGLSEAAVEDTAPADGARQVEQPKSADKSDAATAKDTAKDSSPRNETSAVSDAGGSEDVVSKTDSDENGQIPVPVIAATAAVATVAAASAGAAMHLKKR